MGNCIKDLFEKIRFIQLENEDGDFLKLDLQTGVPESDITHFENSLGLKFPMEIRDFFKFTNGVNFFGLQILPISQLEYFPNWGIISFHSWGNGDLDCIVIDSPFQTQGTILFMNHSPDVTVPIAPSLIKWFYQVFEEIKIKGTLLHPSDYRGRKEKGVYEHVLAKIKGVNCELNG